MFTIYEPCYADMDVAFGMSDGLLAVGYKSHYHTDATTTRVKWYRD